MEQFSTARNRAAQCKDITLIEDNASETLSELNLGNIRKVSRCVIHPEPADIQGACGVANSTDFDGRVAKDSSLCNSQGATAAGIGSPDGNVAIGIGSVCPDSPVRDENFIIGTSNVARQEISSNVGYSIRGKNCIVGHDKVVFSGRIPDIKAVRRHHIQTGSRTAQKQDVIGTPPDADTTVSGRDRCPIGDDHDIVTAIGTADRKKVGDHERRIRTAEEHRIGVGCHGRSDLQIGN